MMKLKFSPWSATLGVLLLLMIASFLGLIPLTIWNIFWLVVTVGTVWAIMRIFFSEPKK